MDQTKSGRWLPFRMGLLAFVAFNLAMATMWGSFGVIMTAIESKLNVGREVSSLAAPIVMITVALLAPVAGILASRMSLRLLMMIGSFLGAAGFAVLAMTSNVQIFLLAHGLLIGPCVCICGTVLPSALVARWFSSDRGRALGFVYIPIAMVPAPLITAVVLSSYGLSAVYVMMAAVMLLNMVAQAFIQDHPSRTDNAASEGANAEPVADGLTTGELVRQKSFWPMTIAYSANIAGTMMLTSHVVSMATGFGNDATKAASLLMFMSLAGLVGPIVFGWLSDRFGGRVMQVVLCVNSAVLWGILLTEPAFPILALVIALFGLHSSGAVPTYCVALTEQLGPASFARAFGFGNLVSLPFTVLAVPLAARIYVQSGSYGQALLIQSVFFVVAALLVMVVGGKRLSLGNKEKVIGSVEGAA